MAKKTVNRPFRCGVFGALCGGGLDAVLDLEVNEFFAYYESAIEFWKLEVQRPFRVVLVGIEKSSTKR